MKKLLSLVLVTILMLALLPAAYAANLYEQTGPVWEWDDADWENAKWWTDTQWAAYFDAEQDAQYALPYDQRWELWEKKDIAMETWTDEQLDIYWAGEDASFRVSQARWREEAKRAIGCPYPEGLNIRVNDAFVAFGTMENWSVPRIGPTVSGSAVAPYYELFRALGAESGFDTAENAIWVVAQNGDRLTLTIDRLSMVYTPVGGEAQTIPLNTAPFYDADWSKQYFVPVRAVAEALGYTVYWDDYYEIITLIHVPNLVSEMDANFTIYNRLMQSGMTQLDETLAAEMDMKADLVLYGDQKHTTASFNMQMDGLQQGLEKLAYTMAFSFDLGQLRALFGEEAFDDATRYMPEFLEQGGTVDVIMNVTDDVFYVRSDIPDTMPIADGDTWLKIETEDLYGLGETFALYRSLNENPEAFTMGSLIYQMAEQTTWGGESPYKTAMQMYKIYALMLGDDGFTTVRSGSESTHTMKLDGPSLVTRAFNLGLFEDFYGLSDLSLSDILSSLPDITGTLIIRENDGTLVNMRMNGAVKIKGAFPVDIVYDFSGDQLTATGALEIKGAFLGKIIMTIDSKVKPANEIVPSAPPEGDPVMTMEEYYDSLYPRDYPYDDSAWDAWPEPEPEPAATDYLPGTTTDHVFSVS